MKTQSPSSSLALLISAFQLFSVSAFYTPILFPVVQVTAAVFDQSNPRRFPS